MAPVLDLGGGCAHTRNEKRKEADDLTLWVRGVLIFVYPGRRV
jgi:hypothetical protein